MFRRILVQQLGLGSDPECQLQRKRFEASKFTVIVPMIKTVSCRSPHPDGIPAVNRNAPLGNKLPYKIGVSFTGLAMTNFQATRLSQGQVVQVLGTEPGLVRVTADDRLVALAEVHDGDVRPVRVFNL